MSYVQPIKFAVFLSFAVLVTFVCARPTFVYAPTGMAVLMVVSELSSVLLPFAVPEAPKNFHDSEQASGICRRCHGCRGN